MRWPGDHVAAAALTFDLDAESAILSAFPHAAQRLGAMSHQAYGPLTGVPRLLRLLDRYEARATFFVPGYTAHRYPDVIRSIVGEGHEVGHHGYLHEPLVGLDIETEAMLLDRGLEALAEVADVRPSGYRAPMWELNYHTPRLLAERGFRYDSSLMDADLPYRLRIDPGRDTASLIEIPVHWGLDDWEQYAYLPGLIGTGVISSPVVVRDMWIFEFDAVRADGGCFVLTCHPFLVGRPGRAAALEALLQHIRELNDVWFAPLSDIALHAEDEATDLRGHKPPVLPT